MNYLPILLLMEVLLSSFPDFNIKDILIIPEFVIFISSVINMRELLVNFSTTVIIPVVMIASIMIILFIIVGSRFFGFI